MECVRKLLLTGFMVFLYEGSVLQIVCGIFVSVIFSILYAKVEPYLMPSNNTFATFVHFQVFFTLLCSLLLIVLDGYGKENEDEMKMNRESLSYALLISTASVLFIGSVLILRSCFNTSEGDFLDTGFDSHPSKESRRSMRLSNSVERFEMVSLENKMENIVEDERMSQIYCK